MQRTARKLYAFGSATSRVAALLAFAVLVYGCNKVGPDYIPPAPPTPGSLVPANAAPNLAPGGGEPGQKLIVGEAIPPAWWQLFHSHRLDGVVRAAIAGSPTIAAARSRLAQAQQQVLAARGGFNPNIDAGALAEREKGPPFATGLLQPRSIPTYNLYSVGVTANYVPDAFGVTGRGVEEQSAFAQRQADQLAAAQLAVSGNVVIAALTIASARLQISAVNGVVSADEKNLALIRERYFTGKAPRTDLLLAKAQLEQDRTPLPPLEQQVGVAQDALAVLIGKPPGAWRAPSFDLADFTLPASLPLSVPSTLVHQRPDILAAEADVHASSAALGVAIGRLYPTITLSGALDPTALTPGAIFNAPNLAWNALAAMTQPIFHGGTLRAERRATEDALRASLATYQETVLESFGQVADILRALGHDADLVKAERQTFDAAQATLGLQRVSYAAGKVDVLNVLAAQRDYQHARVAYARARAQRYIDSAQFLVAMGGGLLENTR